VDGGADSMTVWVDKSTRKVVKMESHHGSMGGAEADHGAAQHSRRTARISRVP